MRRMTTQVSEGETNSDLFAVYKGEKTKEDVFGSIIGGLTAFNSEVEA